ncbi:MAG: GMC oxidoreductase [Syntrophaceae bacterium]
MEKFDVVFIGSGCGAAPAAGNLAQAGAKVCVLERGTWWGALQGKQPYPEGLIELLKHLRGLGWSSPHIKKYININKKAGLLEAYIVNGYTILIPCGVGGASLVIGGFLDKPPRDIYDHYPKEITQAEMAKHFDNVAKVVEPAHAVKNTWYMDAIDKSCERIPGITAHPQDASIWWGSGPDKDEERVNAFGCRQKNNDYSGNELTGDNRSSKNSMDITYLQLVLKHGGEIRDLAEATGIRKTKAGYIVDYVDLNTGAKQSVSAAKVVVGAGALNTAKLLFASRANTIDGLPKISPKLGYKWGFNGDRIGLKLVPHAKLEHGKNPCLFRYHEIASDKYDFDFHQFACSSSVLEWLPWPLSLLSQKTMPFLALAREDPIGRIFPAKDVVDIYYPSQDCHRRANIAQKKIAMEVDAVGKPISEDERQRKLAKIERTGAWKGIGSVHPTGGCAMAETIDEGVIDHKCEVFNYPGLFVCDASIFPIAPCCGPHFFILAHSDRMSKLMIAKEK